MRLTDNSDCFFLALCACVRIVLALHVVSVSSCLSSVIFVFSGFFFFNPPRGFTQPRPVPGARSWRCRDNERLLPPSHPVSPPANCACVSRSLHGGSNLVF